MIAIDLDRRRAAIRRALARTLVATLSLAALVAIGAILGGDFDDTDGRIIATSIGFAAFCATAASGATLRLRQARGPRALGSATLAASAAGFLLLVAALWGDGDDLWRWFGGFALAALAGSHASLVTGARRADDDLAVRTLAATSIALGAVDALAGIVTLTGAVEDGEALGRPLAVLVILLLLTTALPPILRRMGRTRHPVTAPGLAAEVLAAADRMEPLLAGAAPELRREVEQLRRLARFHSG